MSVAAFIDRNRSLIRLWLVLAPSLIGAYWLTGLVNPFWGSLSGFPLYWIAGTHPVYGPHPTSEVLAFFGGPLVVLVLRIWLSDLLLAWDSRWRTLLVVTWALSAFAVVPFYTLPMWFAGWPVWCACE